MQTREKEVASLANEMMRLKQLQTSLRKDIKKYKTINNDPDTYGQTLSCEQKEKLIDNFNYRVERNSWILKKILFKLRTLSH